VGYQVSPLLWTKSAAPFRGRVQTVALRLIVDREREIKAFEKKEYWTIDANLAATKPPAFAARFLGKAKRKSKSLTRGRGEDRQALEKADWLFVPRKRRSAGATPLRRLPQQVAAGFLAQAALQRQAHHDDRAAPL